MHSGWGAMVAISGSSKGPELVDRKRMIIIDPSIPGAKQPYHYAADLPFADAHKHIEKCDACSRALAFVAIRELRQNLQKREYEIVGCAMLLASSRSLPGLADILKSHPLIHTAEGEFFRRVVSQACERVGIPVTGLSERELDARATSEFGIKFARQIRTFDELGRSLGPPWTQDYKRAALAASLVLQHKVPQHAKSR